MTFHVGTNLPQQSDLQFLLFQNRYIKGARVTASGNGLHNRSGAAYWRRASQPANLVQLRVSRLARIYALGSLHLKTYQDARSFNFFHVSWECFTQRVATLKYDRLRRAWRLKAVTQHESLALAALCSSSDKPLFIIGWLWSWPPWYYTGEIGGCCRLHILSSSLGTFADPGAFRGWSIRVNVFNSMQDFEGSYLLLALFLLWITLGTLQLDDDDVCEGTYHLTGPILAHSLRQFTIGGTTSIKFCHAVFGFCNQPLTPFKVHFPKPHPADPSRPFVSKGRKPFQVVHFSDVHIDRQYTVRSHRIITAHKVIGLVLGWGRCELHEGHLLSEL